MQKHEKNWPEYYWMNPVQWNRLVHYMQIQLKRVFPKRRSEINYRKMTYTKEVYVLHKQIKEAMEELKKKTNAICSNHESFEPFALAFGFDFVGIKLFDNMSDGDLNETIDRIKKNKIKIIYPNNAISQSGIDRLVQTSLLQGWLLEVGPSVFSLNIEKNGSGIDTYLSMMEFNLRALTDD